MTAAPDQPRTLSLGEYLTVESLSDVRHEFLGGHVYAMSGGTVRHDLLAQLLNAELWNAYLPEGCRTFTHNRKLRVDDCVYYPDVFVTCGTSAHEQYEDDAVWVVEVASPSTWQIDGREEALAYLALPSLRGYLLADPEGRTMELRTPHDLGWSTTVHGPGDVVEMGPARIAVGELYRRLDELAPR